MAGEQTETGEHGEGSNGTPPTLAAQRAATLAALEAGEHVEAPADDKKKPPEEPDDDDVDEDKDEDADEDDDLEEEVDDEEDADEEDDEDVDDEDDEDKDDKAAEKDPDLVKRLDHVKKLERRAKEHIQREEQRLTKIHEDFIKEWKPQVEAAAKFRELTGKVSPYTAVEILAELGLPVEDFEEAGRVLFAASPKGAEKPENKAYVARQRRDRERDEKLSEMEKKITERDRRDAETAQQATITRDNEQYLVTIAKVAKKHAETFPLAAKSMTADAKDTRARLATIAAEIWEREPDGPRPKAAKVLRAYEKSRARELAALGVDISAIAKTTAKPVQKADAKTGKKPEAKPGDKDEKTTLKSLREHRAETKRLLEEGKLD